MKPMEFWTMEEVFIFTWIGILVAGVGLGLLGSWLMDRGKKKGRDRK